MLFFLKPVFDIQRGNNQTTKAPFTYQKALCYEPVAENIQYPIYFGHFSNTDVECGSNGDDIWFISKSICPKSTHKIPTWTAYNSLLTDARSKTTVQQLPTVNGRLTNCENLLCAIQEAGKVKNVIQSTGKTIISFNLQLYVKAFRLHVKLDIKNDFVFLMGE